MVRYIGIEMLTKRNVAVIAERPYFFTNTIKKPKPIINIAIMCIARLYCWTSEIMFVYNEERKQCDKETMR